MLLRSAILRAPDGDPAGGGSGDGDAGFTEDQIKMIGQIVNQATTAQLKRNLGPGIAEAMKAINWTETLGPEIAKLVPAPQVDPGDGGGKPKGGSKKEPETELEKRIQQLADEVERERKARVDAEQARNKAEQDRRSDAARMKLRNALSDKVAPGALDHAVDRLTLVQQRLSVDESGNVTLRVKRPEYKGGNLVDVDASLDDALPVLLAEDDMKIYLPVPSGKDGKNPGPRGNGSLPTYATPAQNDEEKAKRALEKEQALRARFNLTD